MSDAEANTYTAPDCDRCGTRMYESSRVMRTHDIIQGKAVPRDRRYATWRCPSCSREVPREAPPA
ncbi:MAG: hypothetical protein H6531_01715 [Actinobacteria bacterium]|nr:hypothetical protein [Thermoleophilia bacterium]MCB9010529.1 hypothetical protein [Actinomycetota bacterium]